MPGHANPRRGDDAVIILTVLSIVLIVAALVTGLTLASRDNKVTDPRQGVVHLKDYISKVCDGTTLVYRADTGISSIPNSPEC